jgi:hypothetical protein
MMGNVGDRVTDKSLMGADDIICGCIDLSIEQFRTELNTHPSESFDDLLARTGAGNSCTACLLDLEYLYTSLPGRGDMPKANALFRKKSASKATLKRRIYRILDGIGPRIPYPLEGVAPILIGADIEQRLTVANHSLMFEGNIAAPPIVYAVSVYDAQGNVRSRQQQCVNMGESWRLNLTDMFTREVRAENSLSVGLMKVKWRFRAPGMRGNTRPQIEINARSGSCAVHTQRAGGALERQLTLVTHPTDQRLFLTIVNPTRRAMEGVIQYPILDDTVEHNAPLSHKIHVVAMGASIHEIILDSETASRVAGRPMGVRAVLNNPGYKMHVVYAASDLGRFSIDHL